MSTRQLIRGKGISNSGPYKDLVSNKKEPFISMKEDVLKINFQPAQRFLGKVFDLYSTRTWVLIIIALGLSIFFAVRKVDSNLQKSRAEYHALKAGGYIK